MFTLKAPFHSGAAFCASLFLSSVLLAPVAVSAATLTLDTFQGTHYHSGGNVGRDYTLTTVVERTTGIPITPGGLAFQSTSDIYSGDIPSVASTRLGQGEANADTVGLVLSDGFYFAGSVESVSTCTFKDQLTGCVPFMNSQSRVTMEFTPDMASAFFLDGLWQGGNGTESLVSVVDFFSLSIREIRDVGGPLNIFNIDTNIFNRNQPGGLIDGQLNLNAGATYEFAFFQSAASQSPDASGASDSDFGSFAFAGSFIETNDVAYYQGQVDNMVAAVPLPAGGLLLLTSLGGMFALRRRSKKAA